MDFLDVFEANEQRFFQFNKVYVIENLHHPHKDTGRKLFEDVLRKYELKHKWLLSEHYFVTTRTELFNVLKGIEQDAENGQIFPLVHLEGHGNATGFELENRGSYTLIKWEDLCVAFRRINVATKNNLLLSVASCHGSNLGKGIRLSDRAPFFGFVAPIEEVKSYELEEGFIEFFGRIIDTVDVNHGFDEAVWALRGEAVRFTYQHCETLFRVIADNMVKELRDPEKYQQELHRIIERNMRSAAVRDKFSIPEIIARSAQALNSRGEFLTEWFDHFMMKDLNEPSKD